MRGPPRRPCAWPKVVPTRPTALIGRPACLVAAWHWPSKIRRFRRPVQRARAAYADQAVGNLREAVLRGYTNVEELKTSGAFAPLRGRPDFQQLIHEMARR